MTIVDVALALIEDWLLWGAGGDPTRFYISANLLRTFRTERQRRKFVNIALCMNLIFTRLVVL